MLKAIMIDDETSALKTLSWELERHCPQVEVIGAYHQPLIGLEAIRKNQPDIVFLDIEMPKLTGIDLLQQLDRIDFSLVFVTAYEHYALKAFRLNAIDYLLKPFESIHLIEAVKRIEELRAGGQAVQANIKTKLEYSFKRIPVVTASAVEFLDPTEVEYCQSDGNYSHLIGKKKTLVSKSIGEMEPLLENFGFLRIHKSYMVNIEKITKYVKTDGGYVILENGAKIPVSRRRKDVLNQIITTI
ncbi:MAG: response regulator [Bacteroidota bacterium]